MEKFRPSISSILDKPAQRGTLVVSLLLGSAGVGYLGSDLLFPDSFTFPSTSPAIDEEEDIYWEVVHSEDSPANQVISPQIPIYEIHQEDQIQPVVSELFVDTQLEILHARNNYPSAEQPPEKEDHAADFSRRGRQPRVLCQRILGVEEIPRNTGAFMNFAHKMTLCLEDIT